MEISRMDHRTFRGAHRVGGRAAAPGLARGQLLRLVAAKSVARQSHSTAGERQALVHAIEASQLDLTELAGKVKDEDAEAILAFQIALVEDENLAAPAFALIAGGEAANRAWLAALALQIASYDG